MRSTLSGDANTSCVFAVHDHLRLHRCTDPRPMITGRGQATCAHRVPDRPPHKVLGRPRASEGALHVWGGTMLRMRMSRRRRAATVCPSLRATENRTASSAYTASPPITCMSQPPRTGCAPVLVRMVGPPSSAQPDAPAGRTSHFYWFPLPRTTDKSEARPGADQSDALGQCPRDPAVSVRCRRRRDR